MYGRKALSQNFDSAFQHYHSAAEKGDAIALKAMGVCWNRGFGTHIDNEKSARYYRASAEAGDPKGQYKYSLCAQYGIGVLANRDEAIHWCQRSAEQGYPEGINKFEHLTAIPSRSSREGGDYSRRSSLG